MIRAEVNWRGGGGEKGARPKERGWIGCYRVEDFSISDSKATWTANSFTRFGFEVHPLLQSRNELDFVNRSRLTCAFYTLSGMVGGLLPRLSHTLASMRIPRNRGKE